jgi:drug/metabolite transporter (DMT)-like permease
MTFKLTENLRLKSNFFLRKPSAIGFFLMLGSAFMFSAQDVFIKLLGPEFSTWDLAFYRWGGGFALLLIIFGWQGNRLKTFNLKLMITRSISGCIGFFCLITAIRLIPLSIAMILFFSFPAFAVVISYLIFGERISMRESLCVIGVLCGIAILLGIKFRGNYLGYIMGCLSGAFGGLTVCLIKKLRERDGPVVIYIYYCLIGAIISFPPFIANPKIPKSGIERIMVTGIICFAIVGQLLMNQGFHYCKSWEGGLFLTSELIFTGFFGIYFLREPTTWRFWVGGLLIFGCMVYLNLISVKKYGKLGY